MRDKSSDKMGRIFVFVLSDQKSLIHKKMDKQFYS